MPAILESDLQSRFLETYAAVGLYGQELAREYNRWVTSFLTVNAGYWVEANEPPNHNNEFAMRLNSMPPPPLRTTTEAPTEAHASADSILQRYLQGIRSSETREQGNVEVRNTSFFSTPSTPSFRVDPVEWQEPLSNPTGETPFMENKCCQYCGRSRGLKLFRWSGGFACITCKNPISAYNADVLREKLIRLDNSKQLFGEELELMFGGRTESHKRRVAAELMETVNDMGIIKHDGSVQTGFEIVSVPATLDRIEEQWTPVFENLNTRKIANFVASKNCGMHVHTSKLQLSSDSQLKLLTFFNKSINRKFIEMLGNRELNRYCEQYNAEELFRTGRFEDFHSAVYNKKYLPVATHKSRTVEFRFFKATKSKNLFLANVETVASFVEFVKLTDVRNMLYTKYVDWLLYNKNTYIDKYPHLYELRGKELAQWS